MSRFCVTSCFLSKSLPAKYLRDSESDDSAVWFGKRHGCCCLRSVRSLPDKIRSSTRFVAGLATQIRLLAAKTPSTENSNDTSQFLIALQTKFASQGTHCWRCLASAYRFHRFDGAGTDFEICHLKETKLRRDNEQVVFYFKVEVCLWKQDQQFEIVTSGWQSKQSR